VGDVAVRPAGNLFSKATAELFPFFSVSAFDGLAFTLLLAEDFRLFAVSSRYPEKLSDYR